MHIVTSIDWLSYTIKDELMHKAIPINLGMQIDEPIHPMPRFTSAWNLKPCGEMHNNPRTGLTLVIFRGQDTSELVRAGIQPLKVLDGALGINANITRLDVAIDIIGGDCHVEHLLDAYKKGDMLGTIRTVERYQSLSGNGYTAYFGSRKSDSFVRVYDKAAEQNIDGSWLRIELQLRRDRANALAYDMVTTDKWQNVPRARIKQICDFPTVKWWLDVMENDNANLTAIPRKEPKRVRWLKDQVLPAVAQQHHAYDANAIMQALGYMVNGLMEENIEMADSLYGTLKEIIEHPQAIKRRSDKG